MTATLDRPFDPCDVRGCFKPAREIFSDAMGRWQLCAEHYAAWQRDRSNLVYVASISEGEYSSQMSWVHGVYRTPAAAKAAAKPLIAGRLSALIPGQQWPSHPSGVDRCVAFYEHPEWREDADGGLHLGCKYDDWEYTITAHELQG